MAYKLLFEFKLFYNYYIANIFKNSRQAVVIDYFDLFWLMERTDLKFTKLRDHKMNGLRLCRLIHAHQFDSNAIFDLPT